MTAALRKRFDHVYLSTEYWNGTFLAQDYYRAGGEVVCSTCGRAYADHPDYILAPVLNIICNGDLVKL